MEEVFFNLLEKAIGKSLVRKNQLLKSPFRADKKPSFGIFKYNGTWFFKDFSTGEAGTAVHLFCKCTGLSYSQAIRMLDPDEQESIKTQISFVKKDDVEADYSTSVFDCLFAETGYNGSYFDKIQICEHVCIINKVTFGRFRTRNFIYDDAVRYEVDSIKEGINKGEKYYFPNNKTVRFLGNRKWHHLFGTNSLEVFNHSTYCFIAAGEKDACVLQQIFNAPAIAFNSETYMPNVDMIQYVKGLNKKMVVVYDNDKTGHEYSYRLAEKLRECGITATYRFVPTQYKDVTDMFVAEKTVTLIKN